MKTGIISSSWMGWLEKLSNKDMRLSVTRSPKWWTTRWLGDTRIPPTPPQGLSPSQAPSVKINRVSKFLIPSGIAVPVSTRLHNRLTISISPVVKALVVRPALHKFLNNFKSKLATLPQTKHSKNSMRPLILSASLDKISPLFVISSRHCFSSARLSAVCVTKNCLEGIPWRSTTSPSILKTALRGGAFGPSLA